MLRSRRFWLGTAVSLIFITLFLLRVDLGEMWDALGAASYAYLLPAIAAYFGAVFFRTLRWQYLLRPLGVTGLGRLYGVVVVGYMANNVLPVRLGELARAYYLGTKTNVSKTSALATIAIERVFDGLALLFFLLLVSLSLPLLGTLRGLGESSGIPWLLLAVALSVPFVAALGLLVLLAHNPRLLQILVQRVPRRLRPRLLGLAELFIQGLVVLRSPRRLGAVFLLSLPVWLFEAVMYLLIGYSFGLHELFSGTGQMVAAMLLVTAVANLAIAIPSSPGGIGPFEFFTLTTLVVLGVDGAVASAYAVTLHAALLAPVTLLGLAILWLDNLSLRQLIQARPEMPSPQRSLMEGIASKGDETP